MALILRYRVEPPDALNREIYDALCAQVGTVGLNVEVSLGEKTLIRLIGQFISVEGEHASERQAAEARSTITSWIGRGGQQVADTDVTSEDSS